MYAHVTTYRLASKQEVQAELDAGLGLSDASARAVARWWSDRHPLPELAKLAAGHPFDTRLALLETDDAITDSEQADALVDYLIGLEELLTG